MDGSHANGAWYRPETTVVRADELGCIRDLVAFCKPSSRPEDADQSPGAILTYCLHGQFEQTGLYHFCLKESTDTISSARLDRLLCLLRLLRLHRNL